MNHSKLILERLIQRLTGNPNNLELDVRISTGSAPTENVNGSPAAAAAAAPRKAGLRVAMDRVRLEIMLQDRFSYEIEWILRKVAEQVMREKSAAREVSLPRELASRLVSLSRADISQVMSSSVRIHNVSSVVITYYHLSGAEAKLCGLGWAWWCWWGS